jgi:hypothetical protein
MVIQMPLTSHKTKLIAFTLGVLLLVPLSAFAKIGEVTKQTGQDASISRDSDSIVVGEGTGINMNDAITTSRAKLELTFDDNTKVRITKQSKLIIDDFVYDANSGTGKLAMNVAMGTVRYASGAIARNSRENVRLRTPTATIAVRGTDFTMTVDEIGRSLVILLPTCPEPDEPELCFTGEIEVSTDVGMVILNQAFQATVVASANSNPTKPKIIDILERNIDNMLIISPPKELPGGMAYIDQADEASFLEEDAFLFEDLIQEYLEDELAYGELDIDFLDFEFLDNILDLTNMLKDDALDIDPVLPNIHEFKGYIQYSYNEEGISIYAERAGTIAQVKTAERYSHSYVNITMNGLEAPLQINDGGTDVVINITQSD